MFKEGSDTLQINSSVIKSVQIEVIKALRSKEYSLNTVNSFGENLLHISAANGCLDIIKEILQKPDACRLIDKKNKFGWTPLMLAIRNRHIETVKYLLGKNANVNESTYLGMSVIGLAAAINKDMFEIVHKACPSASLNSMNDNITPLCIAAMKNDKNLFFHLIELGFDISKNNDYTDIMIKQSIVPEIKNLAKHLDIEDYWNDNSDNILVETDKLESNIDDCNNNFVTNFQNFLKPCTLDLTTNQLNAAQHSLISPTLSCAFNEILPTSPNIYFTQNENINKIDFNITHDAEKKRVIQNQTKLVTYPKNQNSSAQQPLQRLQSIRPPDLNIQSVEEEEEEENLNTTIGYVPDFSPLRSPNVPSHINDENVFGDSTPTPPRYKTPPKGMILNSEEMKLFVLLKSFGLSQHTAIFLEQEVDFDLFMTLTNQDLIEIGIENEADRKALLNVIKQTTQHQ
ncbi:uncharacterized protein LOC143423539 [Xylocopa sonorina]|uniref:uncharacterized protein LOC143423539 n=1 Tax=Xylocopa sonorina TaxID=1818115 RepID=UPI00403ADCC6